MQQTATAASGRRLARAIAYALGLAASAPSWSQVAPAASAPLDSGGDNAIQEIVVTATRRSENLQDVPIAITAFTGATLQELNVQTLDDYVRYLPNVTISGAGPGQNEVYMRGLSTSHDGLQVAGGYALFPNVALYLDDQSVQLPGRNLDVYAADLDRIEVLEGPQGTLFGAGAQAGAIRYITNKPKLGVTEGGVSASYSTTAHGDPSAAGQAFLNVSLLDDKLALRAAIYDDHRGGYINNVPGTFARLPTDEGIVNYFNGVVPANSQTLSNNNLVGNGINTVDYTGIRASAYAEINEDWNVFLQQSYQNMEADGVFAYNAALGDLEVQQYNPSVDKDKFEDTAWTVNGRAGPVKLVYTGGYLVRNVDQVADYTAYARGAYADYYQCNGPSITPGTTPVCYSPSSTWHNVERNTHQTHEVRASTPDDWRLRGILGLFWEDYKIQSSQNFAYGQEQAGFSAFGPLPGITTFDPSERPAGTVFLSDLTRGYRQKAVFGEVAFDLLPKTLTLTLGSRYYRFDNYVQGQSDSEYGCRNIDPCVPPDGSFKFYNLSQVNSGHKDKVNLSYKPIDGVLLYATYSSGFRPGGFNRGASILSPKSPLYGQFTIPAFYNSDDLKNYELGWKTDWFNRRLQFNGAIYQENWSHVQMSIYDPTLYGNGEFGVNGPNYRVRGVETNVVWRATDQLTLDASTAWNSSEQTNVPTLQGTTGVVALFPTNGLGSSLANSPPLQRNIRARYEYPLGDYRLYAQGAAQHTAHTYTNVITQGAFGSPDYDLSGYTTYDAALGAKRDAWEFEAFVQNLTDTRAEVFIGATSGVKLTTTNRPRTAGVRFAYKFSMPH